MKPEEFKEWFRALVAQIPKEQVKAELAEARAYGGAVPQCLLVDLNSQQVSLLSGTINNAAGIFTFRDPSWEASWCIPASDRHPTQKEVVEMPAVYCGEWDEMALAA